eukprot:CAMPEP_0170278464 /NCGR_PEP_ID=MMETSP0116_2-20130129/39236_1 /TAXON_ID=400756 /ORGANISM="Durinskia baltica, Strain CSIRO CS-38" /LENGTH=346 /DNA_ID=CAMNT_0010529775 /DNA_START=42 /DNA_END=1082 /DNA_ORIENTATION=-
MAAAASPEDCVVCVTGGTGFLGSWVVKLLLEQGYRVNATTRTAEKAAYLKGLPGAERLTVFDGVDNLQAGAFDGAISGCKAVIHTASPFYMQDGSEEKLVRPAVEGTRNVLDACRRLGVEVVALTSTTGAIYADYGTRPKGHVYTEEDWSPEEVLRANKNWYCLSKTLAEKLAWQMSSEPGCPYRLTVLNPTLIFGPMLPGQPHLNTSASTLARYMDGSAKEIENACKTIVDIRDVAYAHVEAIKRDVGGKRFLLIGGSPHFSEIAGHIREALPEDMKGNVPTQVSESLGPWVMGSPPPEPVYYNCERAERELGVSFRSVEEQVKSMVTSMLENGLKSLSQYVPDK